MRSDDRDSLRARVGLADVYIGQCRDVETEALLDELLPRMRRVLGVDDPDTLEAGDLEQTRQRLAKIELDSDESGGFMGMYL